MDLTFKHLGVAVRDLAAALPVYRDVLGYRLLSGPFDDPLQQVAVCFLGSGRAGEPEIELVAPLTAGSPVGGIVGDGGGAYHLCYECGDLDAAIVWMASKGCVTVRLPSPAVAFAGRRIAWLFTPTRQLLELVERA